MRALRRVLREAFGWHRGAALAVLAGFGMIASAVGLLATSAWLIARAALRPPLGDLRVAIAAVRAFGIARPVLRYLERLVAHRTTLDLLARLRTWFFRSLEPLAPARLIERRGGDLLSRAVADVEQLEQLFVRVVAPPAVAALTTVAASVFVGWFHPMLGGVLLTFLLLGALAVPLTAWWSGRSVGFRLSVERGALGTALVDALQGAPELLAAGRAADAVARARQLGDRVDALRARLAVREAGSSALALLVGQLAVVALLIAAIPLVRGGVIDGVSMTVVLLAALASFEAIGPLATAAVHARAQEQAAARVLEIVDTRPAVVFEGNEEAPPSNALALEDVAFTYPGAARPALDGVDLSVPEGARLALVGPSGAGKSTIAQLLVRFWDPETGRITLGGIDLRDLSEEALRSKVGLISQRTELITGTLRDNLSIASPEATDAALLEALRAARLQRLVGRVPAGLDTPVGEQGSSLSAGERQRLALARALLRDTPVLVLDEPTANLDAVNARELLETMLDAASGRTCLLITHELSLAARIDDVALLESGRVTARGPHDRLLQTSPDYRALWQLERELLA